MSRPAATRLPARYTRTVVLRDGSSLVLRPIRPDDQERLVRLFSRLSPQTVYLRFHRAVDRLTQEEARRFSDLDYEDAFALVATVGNGTDERIIAVGRYARLPRRDAAEVGFLVEDAYQGKGIGTHLLEQLATIAREKGILSFKATLIAENQEMLKVLQQAGFKVESRHDDGFLTVAVDIAPSPAAEHKSAEREKESVIASLKAFLSPRSVAVIGASRREGTIGNILFRNLLLHGFRGVAYPVNPTTSVVASVKAYPSVVDIPGDVDLGVIIVPAAAVNRVAEQCGRKGVRGLIVISAGFTETGGEGKDRQKKLLETARNYGMRIVGPNCMGVINTNKDVSMNATFSPVFPPLGSIGFCTQSGALGLAILEYARNLNLGLSTFVSVGNRVDVSSNDFLQYWEQDEETSVILLYLETFGNPRKFARIARSLSEKKPIVAVKPGRTAAGSRAAASHTGALAATEVGTQALARQTGVIRVDTLEELFDVAMLLRHQPVPAGNRVAIVTNGGGPGILTADACASRGLEVPPLTKETELEMRKALPPGSSLANPVDMTAEASAAHYRAVLDLLARDPATDMVVAIFIPPIVTQAESVASAIREVAPEFRKRGKTLVASFMGSRGKALELGTPEQGYVPAYVFPESTASALAHACEYGQWLRKPRGSIPILEGIDREHAREIIIKAAMSHPEKRPLWLPPEDVNKLLQAYGITVTPAKIASTPDDAASAGKATGFPVAVKLVSSTITHKTDIGGVILNVQTEVQVREAFEAIKQRLANLGRASEMQGVLVQKMASRGVEVIVGVTQDQTFGPLVMFGLGGTYAELFRDVAFRIHPLTDQDAREQVRSVKAWKVLEGWRGAPPSDSAALEQLLLRVSAMIEDLPQIAELDLNPVIALPEGYEVVDARVLVT